MFDKDQQSQANVMVGSSLPRFELLLDALSIAICLVNPDRHRRLEEFPEFDGGNLVSEAQFQLLL